MGLELKIAPDKATAEQIEVLAALKAAGAQTMIAYPEMWPQVEALLKGQPDA